MIKRWLAVVLLLCMMLNMTAGSLAQVQSAAHSAMHIATDGEADIATDGEADIATDGEADIATDGEADIATNGEATEEPCEHEWDANGVCTLCGQQNACLHTNTWQQESYTAEHVSTGDGLYHNKVYQLYYNINCDDCGATGIAQEPIGEHIEQYQHEWDANGVCTLCGQQNACPHANTWQQESYTAEHTSTGDPMYHDCLYRFYYNTNCDDCGATGLAQEQFDEYTEQYQHEWDASGVCSLCEQVNTCGHETEELHHSSSENHRYVSTGDVLQHDYVYDVYAYPICTTCGMYLPRVFVGTYVSYQTGHNWNTDGVCTDCAQVNTCPHDGGTSVSNEILNWRYEDTGDVKYHYNVYDLYEMTFCDVCSMRISQVFVNTERSESEHNWNDQAVCWECGQVNACAHTGGEYSYEIWQNHRSENVNNLKQHEAVADVYDTFFCNDCRLRLREEFNRVERNLEDHWWCQDGEQYICGGCQMVNTCTHTGEVTTEKWWTNGRFEDVGSPDYHNYLTDAYQSVFCADCRLFLEDQELGVEVRQDPHYYFDGKCESCGAACAHSETYVNLVQDDYQWVNVNELSYHEYHYADYNETRCSVCSMVIGRELVQSYADRYTHAWNDEGVCSACGMVNTCEHADTYHSRGYGFDFYEHASEAGKHYRTCNVIDYTYCSTCAMTLEEKTEGVERTLESHNYTDGVCDCGYVQGACEHPNAQQTGGSQKYKTFEKISNTEHSYSFDVYWKYSCPDCGVEYEVYIERGTETDVHTFLRNDSHTVCELCGAIKPCETHTWINGVCSVCGTACAHDGGSYISTVELDRMHVNVGSFSYHEYRYNVYTASLCMDCNSVIEVLGLESQGNVMQVGHAWNENGICEPCGMRNSCAHNWTTETTRRGSEFYERAAEAGSHYYSVEFINYEYCETCRITLWEKLSSVDRELQAHSYVNGVCACGAQENSCQHPNAQQTGGSQKYKTYLQLSDTEHSYSFDVYWAYSCPDCGESYEVYIEHGTEQENHRFSSIGECACGAWCNHLNSTEQSREMIPGTQEQLDGEAGADFHKQWYTENVTSVCHDCQQVYTIPYSVVREEGHTYDENGVCLCGAEGEPTTCAHENTETREFDVHLGYSPMDGNFHVREYDTYEGKWCLDCQTYRNRQRIAECSVTEVHVYDECVCICGQTIEPCAEHSWYKGACYICGTKNPCTHENSTNWQPGTWENAVYTYKDQDVHHVVYDYAERYTCNDCGEDYTVIVDTGREDDEAHEWAFDPSVTECRFCGAKKLCDTHTWVDGVCSVCGMENTCEHPNAQQTGGSQKNKIFEKIDDLRHSYSFDVYWKYACPDCGENYEVYIERGIEDEDHLYQDGVCTVCLQACGHKVNGNTWVDYEMVFHDPVSQDDADFHLQPYTTTNFYQCSACQQQYTTTSEMEGEEAHQYDENGLCACGAAGEPTTCLHENKAGQNFEMNVRYSDAAQAGHTKTADVFYGMWCPDCETYRMRQLDTPNVVTVEEHTYVDGVCACGWVNTCEHPNAQQTGGSQKNKVFAVKDETQHTYSFDVYWKYACPDCGENYEVYIERGTEEDVHTFLRDDSHTECQLCGYVRGTVIVPECRMALPAMLKTIGEQAFANLTAVTHFIVPAGVESIADDAFPAGVTIVAPEGSYAQQWAQTHEFAFEALSAE